MRLIFFAHGDSTAGGTGASYLRFALSAEPLAEVVLTGLSRHFCKGHGLSGSRGSFVPADDVAYALPQNWATDLQTKPFNVATYTDGIPIRDALVRNTRQGQWFVVSNGRFATQLNCKFVEFVLKSSQADLLAINATPELMAYCLNVRLTSEARVVGFRRAYSDSVEPAPITSDWPHHLLINADVLEQLPPIRPLQGGFSDFARTCQSIGLRLSCVNVAGSVLDLETQAGLLSFCTDNAALCGHTNTVTGIRSKIADNVRFVGRVLLGKSVSFGSGVVIIGPTIIGDNARIENGATISSSIIGPGVSISPNQFVYDRIVPGPRFEQTCPSGVHESAQDMSDRRVGSFSIGRPQQQVYRTWPPFSYMRCAKRIADIIVALIVIILFAPFIPLIALAIKLTSPGPVFYKDRRQGLHGRVFNCTKFRTMRVGAHAIQEKLRVVSEVDGPQFKITDDPRITAVGRFLRETYIDEVPQFFNVLLGHMSVVGPRPSPESENTLCPWWRDARLSVRPGITGLWQVCRTRRPMQDFQEWIFYDTKYVRELSLKLDSWISWRTARKMIHNFVAQF